MVLILIVLMLGAVSEGLEVLPCFVSPNRVSNGCEANGSRKVAALASAVNPWES